MILESVQAGWFLAWGLWLCIALILLLIVRRRREVRAYATSHRELVNAKERGSDKARLQHPKVDLSQCIGCGTCVAACPEDGVLTIMHGQAVIVHGSRCVGHGLCVDACPVGGIALTLGDLSSRRDLPALTDDLEATGVPGLFVAGELGGFSLVRTAVTQGIAVAEAVAGRLKVAGRVKVRAPEPALVGAATGRFSSFAADEEPNGPVDLLVVGAGPGGLACSLRAKELGLNFLTIEQEDWIGGTVASYPRRKMVMTQPMRLPLHGRLTRQTYEKEELIEIWETVLAEQDLPIRLGVRLTSLCRNEDGLLRVETTDGTIHARHVCLALGRRGTPRKLDVPGEDLPKVAYSLLDAVSYQNRRILIVGGGDSAIEAALGLAEQVGNEVTLSYRKKAFFRLKAKNDSRIHKAIHEGRVRALYESEVVEIEQDQVRLRNRMNEGAPEIVLPNDDVFVFAGGIPPFGLLEKAGISFNPEDRPQPVETADRGSALPTALSLTLLCTVALLGWATWHHAYYGLDSSLRPFSPLHSWLRPAGAVGLSFGLLACGLFGWNLAYLLRRSPRFARWLPGSLRFWMGSHVFTGLVAFLCVLLHAGFAIKNAVGGHAFAVLTVVIVWGSIGRYLYAFFPRAANGAEVDLNEIRTRLAALSDEWDGNGREYAAHVHEQVDGLISAGRWRPGLAARIWAIVWGQFRLRQSLRRLRVEGRRQGVRDKEVRRIQILARRAYRLTLLVTHYEEVRAVVSSWRFFHRWLSLVMILLAISHIYTAMWFAQIDWQSLPFVGAGGP